MKINQILVFIVLSSLSLSLRLEPINIFKQRENFYSRYFPYFANKLHLNHTETDGYRCVVSEKINKNEIIFNLPKNYSYSVYEEFPLKDVIYRIVKKDETIKKNKNILNNILLTIRLLFDTKANITEIFILTKKHGHSEEINYSLDSFRQYLKSRTDFIAEYLKNLPQVYSVSQTSWSEDDISHYSQTGSIPVFKSELIKIYNSLINECNRSHILALFTNNWLNLENLSYLLSLYGYVATKSYNIGTNPYSQSLINQKIQENGANTLIPLLDLCYEYNYYNFQSKEARTFEIEFNDQVIIRSMKNYEISDQLVINVPEEFTNDYLLLNYGEVLKDKNSQHFIFKMDIIDKDYNFYNSLRANGFNLDLITIENNKISIQFPLRYGQTSVDLLQFIKIFLNMFKSLDSKKNELSKSLSSLMNKNSYKELKIYLLYFLTIDKNMKKFLEDNELTDMDGLYEFMIENKKKINKLNHIIETNTEKFIKDRNLTDYIDDDFQNLFYFKTLHSLIKRDLISEFNLENLKIISSHQNVSLNSAMKILYKNINQLKNKYI